MFAGQGLHLIIGEIYGETYLHPALFKAFTHLVHPPAERAVQTLQGKPHGFSAGSGDHFCHSLGLAQVHSSVEKGPVGKFAAARGLSPRRDAGRQDLVYDSLAAMALYFGAVLPRICVRRGHEDTEDIIQRLPSRIEHTAVAQFPGDEFIYPSRSRPEYSAHNIERGWTGETDDCYGPAALGRGLGSDGRFS